MKNQQDQLLKAKNAELQQDLVEIKLELKQKCRELEIEAALERVRIKAMAMRTSNDVGDATESLFNELENLGINTIRCGIIIGKKEERKIELWTATAIEAGNVMQIIGEVEVNIHPLLQGAFEAWEQKKEFFSFRLEGEDKERYYQSLSASLDYPISNRMSSLPDHYCTSFMFKEGGLFAFTFELFSAQNIEIFKRFSVVFSLTYRRYLDLKQAEGQAREAQIEAALERVRARTMAMQHSDELAEASFLLDSQIRALGIKTRGCAFHIYGENESTEWFSSEMGTMPTYKTPRENVFLEYYEAGQRGESMLMQEFVDEACAVHYEYLCTLPVMGEALIKMIESGGSFPTRQIDHVTYFKYGYLLFITLEPLLAAIQPQNNILVN